MPVHFTRALADTLYLFQSQGTTSLSTSFTITGASGVYQDTGLSVTLPSAGVYRLFYTARGVMNITGDPNGGHLQVKLYNSTDATDVPDGNMLLFLTIINDTTFQFSGSVSITYTITSAPKTIQLHARRTSASGTFNQSIIASNDDGKTTLSYQKISN